MINYFYTSEGKIRVKSTDNNTQLFNKEVVMDSIASDVDIDINNYYVVDGVITPAEFIPYTLSDNAVAVDVDAVITVDIGTKYHIKSSEVSERGVVDDGTLEFSSGIPGKYLIELEKAPYKTTYIVVEVTE